MHLHIERWIARPAWLALSVSDRIAYLDQMGDAFRALTRAGVRLVGVAVQGAEIPHRTGERYVAAWVMPEGPTQVRQLEKILAAAEWQDYFVPVTDRGPRPAVRSFFDFMTAPMDAHRLAKRKN